MGKTWDSFVPGPATWRECYRVLKPGGYLLCFAGTRTLDMMGIALRMAGFELRDCIMFLHGQGFPKSLSVGKAIDKTNGDPGRLVKFTQWMRTTGLTARQIDEATGTNMGGHYLTSQSQPAIPTRHLWQKLRPLCGNIPAWVDDLVERIEAERAVICEHPNPAGNKAGGNSLNMSVIGMPEQAFITAPATDAAKQWEGWGTALKPAFEPIVLARKPLSESNVAANVLRWGTGALNIGACRIGTETRTYKGSGAQPNKLHNHGEGDTGIGYMDGSGKDMQFTASGRWPANVILGHHPDCQQLGTEVEAWNCHPDCPCAMFPETGKSTGGRTVKRSGGGNVGSGKASEASWSNDDPGYGDQGSAARFFAQVVCDTTCELCGLLLTARHGTISVKEDVPCKPANTAVETSYQRSDPNDTAPMRAVDSLRQDDSDKESKQPLFAKPAERSSCPTQAPNESIAPSSAGDWDAELLLHNVKSAASLCDSCATSIAHALAAPRTRQNQESLRFPAYMPDATRKILIQNLVPFAALLENTATTPTTESLSILFGSVRNAIAENIRQDENDPSTASGQTRFRYCSKATKSDRWFFCHDCQAAFCETKRQNHDHGHLTPDGKTDWSHITSHPTVKPVELIRYLQKLVTPPNGTTLDCFLGTATAAVAATIEHFHLIGIEQDETYLQIATARSIDAYNQHATPLFNDA